MKTRSNSKEASYVTPVGEIAGMTASLRKYFNSGATRSYEWRISQIHAMLKMMNDCKEELSNAVGLDNNMSDDMAFVLEINTVIHELHYAEDNLKSWMAPQRVGTDIVNLGGSSWIQFDPLGVTTIIGAFNYPIQLCLIPLIGSIVGGNTAFVKPSESCPNVANTLRRICKKYLDPSAVEFVVGAIPETTELLAQDVDLIFFTGSIRVGRIVMQAAAKKLIRVVLELGGKSPIIVDETADLDLAARRLIWGKTTNCGQTCIAPDYVLISDKIADKFISKVKGCLETMYGDDIRESPDFPRVQNKIGFERISKLVENDNKNKIYGGRVNKDSQKIELTLFDYGKDLNEFAKSPAMEDEIFGPALPMARYTDLSEAISFITSRPKPLTMTCFTTSSSVQKRITEETSSGSLIFNECLLQMLNPELPFGGVGTSGMGSYHGKFSFKAFTHEKACMAKSAAWDILPWRYANVKDDRKKRNGILKLLVTAHPVWLIRTVIRTLGMIPLAILLGLAYKYMK